MWNKKDAPDLFEYAKNPNVGPWAGWKPHRDVAESRMIIEACLSGQHHLGHNRA